MSDRVNIRDVATAAGVSVTTVSHALNGRGKVSPSTRQRVSKIAFDLGYAPNRVASALRLNRTGIIGFVSDEIATTPFAGRIVLGAQEAAAERDMTLMLVNSNNDVALERRQIDALLAQQVDAMLYATMGHRAVEVPAIPASVPLVLVNSVARHGEVGSVVPDEYAIGRTATRALLEAGHTAVAHLTITEPGFGVAGRTQGYVDEMAATGLPGQVVASAGNDASAAAGRDAVMRAMQQRPELTAVFCFNDPMAMGVYQVAATQGIKIPSDLSVVGVDDLEIISAQLQPTLTTLSLPHAAMGRWAVHEAVRLLDGGAPSNEVVRLECPLVGRNSIALHRGLPVHRPL